MILAFLLILALIPILYLIPADESEKQQHNPGNIEAIAKADHFVAEAPWNR